MPGKGWKRLLAGTPWFNAEGAFPIEAYSEFIPPPRLGPKPYGTHGVNPLPDDDPFGWNITEYEEAFELRPGLATLARQVVGAVAHLGNRDPVQTIARGKLINNPYWPAELAEAAGKLPHERYVVLLPLALSRTQDDKGRVRWTLFGGSEQGPERAFWKSFFRSPNKEAPDEEGIDFIRGLLAAAYGVEVRDADHLHHIGFRVLASSPSDDPLPTWTVRYQANPRRPAQRVKYLLTFRPFGKLPEAVRRAYLAGELNLLPFPGSLVFWGTPWYLKLREQLPFALQIPLLHLFHRHEDPQGIRVPQSGWMHEPRPGQPGPDLHHGPLRNTYKRSHRWERVLRHEDELTIQGHEDKLAHVLFSTLEKDIGLYGKPMARNAQLWTHDGHFLLDGPSANPREICDASAVVAEGGLFGYRFIFPAMRIGRHEIYWHRPLAAYLSPETKQPALLPSAPLGYLTAYNADRPNVDKPIELWPRLLRREGHTAAVDLFDHVHDEHPNQTARNVRKLLDSRELLGKPLPPTFARQMLAMPRNQTLGEWLTSLSRKAADCDRGRDLFHLLWHHTIESPGRARRLSAKSLTYRQTANRKFEVRYWQTIYDLAHGQYCTKNNADCVQDDPTQKELPHLRRDLDDLGNYLLGYYEELIGKHDLRGRAVAGDIPFSWRTAFPFQWMGGWQMNQKGEAEERDVVLVIPGRDRSHAVIMADHYDTAYMVDRYDPQYGGTGARLAAAGADDNHSATAALMLAAPIFLAMSRAGTLGCDVWLVHLTGEEFPADCMGARALSQRLVEGTLQLRLADGSGYDLSGTRVRGVYVSDMIAHNKDHERDIFQISPGVGPESLWLAYQAHLAAEAWNAGTRVWNRRSSRKGCKRGQRSADGKTVPATAQHLELDGQVRLPYDPRSTVYNTDGQIFSDAGVPVVLFMENYDINRCGYHDMHDTMENIDLDYGAAVAAIVIESVARAATEKPPS
jgi:Peptidase family M28